MIFALLLSMHAYAGTDTRTPPKGRFAIVVGNIYTTGTDYEFTKDGTMMTVGDAHATDIKQQALAMGSRSTIGSAVFAEILKIFNATPAGQAFVQSAAGTLDSFDLGTMSMNVKTTGNITAPTIMGGVTNWWAFGVNIPYVRLKTEPEFVYHPGASNDGLDQLSAAANAIGITAIPNRNQFVGIAKQTLIDKGYRAPVAHEKKFLGDIRLLNLFDLGRTGRLSFGAMNTIGLPTGPKHDPDDLFDSGAFHVPFIEQEFTGVYSHTRQFKSYASGGLRYNFAMKEKFRIPVDDQDFSPDKAQTEEVTRTVGMSNFVEAGMKYRLLERFQVLGGLIRKSKSGDVFQGERGLNYQALSNMYPNVPSEALIYKIQASYDPLTNYKVGRVPLMVDVSYEQTFAGKNAPALKQLMFSVATGF